MAEVVALACYRLIVGQIRKKYKVLVPYEESFVCMHGQYLSFTDG